MKLGIFAKAFDATRPDVALTAARAAGYEAVQYNMACSGLEALPMEVPEAVAQAVQTASRDSGIEIVAVSATYNMVHPDPGEREKGRKSFAAIGAAAHAMGTRLLTVCTGSRDAENQWRHHSDNEKPESWLEMCREFALLLPLAEQYDFVIGIEPELANVVSSAALARKLLDAFQTDRLGVVLDPANLFDVETSARQKVIVESAIDLLGDYIVLAHAKDRLADGHFAVAGKGVIDFPHYITALRRAGFDGALVTHGLAAQDAPGVSAFLSRVLAEF
ncbi:MULTISPECIES: sugar phosphate isomerase/epimerase [unclassified Acidisoma]|jgi:sugar phosphate isomerase/epimerase|uniref:sugar phosphate isomerase/epimerase family protein n=1 Tax=unclassified Acidisoma TaxID=2634065 RepID=UPI00131D8BFF|nr:MULTISPECIES: sugar phosphate isomerase/epimerase [unclassified Acidisoma]